MTIQEILNTTTHRPWEAPTESWAFYQEWNNAVFLHWEVELAILKQFVPKELEIDLFNGKPWVSLVAFTMEKIRPKNLPACKPISTFHEINIRTYVKLKGKTGVYFLSIEAGNYISCKLAKAISELPYRFSKMKRDKNSFTSINSKFNDKLKIKYSLGNHSTNKTKLDTWLTERYALFQDTKTSMNMFEIHHLEWPITEIHLEELNLGYDRFNELINNKPNITHYSKGVKVMAWEKQTITNLNTQ